MPLAKPPAAQVARDLLAREMPGRFAHVSAVAARATDVTNALDLDSELLVDTAWLHDIGYAPAVAQTGFHPLDGARHARHLGYSDETLNLIAFHTGAEVEAGLRGLRDVLRREFRRPIPDWCDLLTYCDLTVDPRGRAVTVGERIEEILKRYDPDDVVHQAIQRSTPELIAAVERVERRLTAQSQ